MRRKNYAKSDERIFARWGLGLKIYACQNFLKKSSKKRKRMMSDKAGCFLHSFYTFLKNRHKPRKKSESVFFHFVENL